MTETEPDMLHILVVDDDRRLRELLQRYLTREGFVVSAAESAEDALARMSAITFDAMVLDVMMRGMDGVELTRKLRGEGADLPILLLTARGEPEHRITGLEAGADDYLAKPFEPRELLLRLKSILRRQPPQPVVSGGLRLGPFSYDAARTELLRDGQPVPLTDTERQLLAVLAKHADEILDRDRLAELTGTGAGSGGNSRGIDVQVTRLRRKIERDPKQPRYLQTVRGQGYVLRPDPA